MDEEQRDEVFQAPQEFESRFPRQRQNGNVKRYGTIIVLIIVLGFIIFGVTRFIGGTTQSGSKVTPTPTVQLAPEEEPTPTEPEEQEATPTEKPTNTPTPKPTVNPVDKATGLDRSKLSVHVKNGSGAVGAGKKASDYLESLGYNVIQVGNADNFNYEKTTIQIKSASANFLELLKKDLSANYSVGTTSADLAESENAAAIVIIGKE